jgi:hypothetical protein
MSTVHRNQTQIWRWPIVLAILITIGLVSALLGEGGVWWLLSWVSLCAPLAVIGIAIFRLR